MAEGHSEQKIEEKMPGWIKGAKWERAFRFPKKRTDWNRLVLFQPAVGEMGVALRYRLYEKTERVTVKLTGTTNKIRGPSFHLLQRDLHVSVHRATRQD